MANLVLGIAGAAIGSLGGPAGAQAGFLIGSAIGSALDPQKVRSDGPRLSDLSVQVSTYGAVKPVIYGTMRTSGNVIWASEIRETAHTTSQSGKGGPTVESTTYTYDVDVAIALCEGPIDGVVRIWADGKLIYSNAATADAKTLVASADAIANMTVYLGDETQLPDPTMEAALGAGNVPAYRGTALVVFAGLQLADYGNRVPNFTFEVVTNATASINRRDWASTYNLPLSNPASGAATYIPSDGSEIVLFSEDGQNDTGFGYKTVQIISMTPDSVTVTLTLRLVNQSFSYRGIPGVSDEPAIVYRRYSNTDGNAMTYLRRDGSTINFPMTEACGLDSTTSRFFKRRNRILFSGDTSSGNGRFLALYAFDSQVRIAATTIADNITSVALSDSFAYAWCVLGTGTTRIYKLSLSNLSVVATYDIAGNEEPKFYVNAAGTLYTLRTSGLDVFDENGNFSFVSTVPVTGKYANFAVTNYLMTVLSPSSPNVQPATINLRSYAGATVPLSAVVSDVCSRAALTAVDTSAMSDQLVGYAVTSVSPARSSLEQLLTAFFYDAQEVDGVLRFAKRGGAAVATILVDELGAGESGADGGDPFALERAQEVDLPRTVSVSHLNSDADYQPGTETSRRLVTRSVNDVSQSLAIAMPPAKAAQIADVLLYDAWVGRTTRSFTTSRRFAHLDAGDVVSVEYPAGTWSRLRVTKTEYAGALVKFSAAEDDAGIVSTSSTAANTSAAQSSIGLPSPTVLVPLDMPILRDTDDDAGYYVALYGTNADWRGATLLKSTDNANFSAVDSVLNGAVAGYAASVLPNWTGGLFFDEASTVDVVVPGALSSTTKDALWLDNTLNAMLIGSEIVQFRTATLLSAGKYRLSGLLRGLRGTERTMTAHAVNETVVLLGVAGTLRVNGGTVELNAKRYLEAISFGRSTASSVAFTNTGIGLMPLSPVQVGGGRNAAKDVLLKWSRRTRYSGVMLSNADIALGEISELYDVDITDSTFTTVKRTFSNLTTPAATYTAAQQTTDFGSLQATVYAVVYQRSSVVGRGYGAKVTL